MKKNLVFLVCLISASAFSYCSGSSSSNVCFDNNGNTYIVQRSGNTTYTTGTSSSGRTWNEIATTSGPTTYITGTAANGNTWNETIQRNGNSTYINGTDKNGNAFNKICFNDVCN